ncbi:RPL17, partial [Symbiodinium sp. KB8]
MVRYGREPENPAKAAKSRGAYLRVHFKQCREVGAAINGMGLSAAQRYLQDVLDHKRAVPFLRFTGGIGRHAQAKLMKVPGSKVAWPEKASRHFLDLLNNAEAN